MPTFEFEIKSTRHGHFPGKENETGESCETHELLRNCNESYIQ